MKIIISIQNIADGILRKFIVKKIWNYAKYYALKKLVGYTYLNRNYQFNGYDHVGIFLANLQ